MNELKFIRSELLRVFFKINLHHVILLRSFLKHPGMKLVQNKFNRLASVLVYCNQPCDDILLEGKRAININLVQMPLCLLPELAEIFLLVLGCRNLLLSLKEYKLIVVESKGVPVLSKEEV